MTGPATPPSSVDWRVVCVDAAVDERRLRSACRRRSFVRGEVVFHEGDPAGAIHLIETGHVTVRLTTPLGDAAIVDVLQPGDTFGEQALIHEGDRMATITAISPTETLSIDAERFIGVFGGEALQRFMIELLSRRLGATNRQLVEARYVPADQRLARCVDRLGEQFADVGDGAIPLTQTDIASMIGVTRSTVNRLLRSFEGAGAIEIQRGRILVRDRRLLDRRSGVV